MSPAQGGGGPDMQAVRAARSNVRYHLRYIGHLIRGRNWLAGDRLTYADLAAAAHLSCLDYLGDVQWDENDTAQVWYARVGKSAPVCPAPSSPSACPAPRPARPTRTSIFRAACRPSMGR